MLTLRLVFTLRPIDFDFYLVTDRKQTRDRTLLDVVSQALDAGTKAIQLRERDLEGRELLELALAIKKLCDPYRASLFVNDRVDIALGANADVHLTSRSLPTPVVRALVGEEKAIGVSTHSVAEARAAAQGGADFIVFGPIYFTPSKASYGRPQGLSALRETSGAVAVPVFAIGGIKANLIPDVKAAGAKGVALISAVMAADDPAGAAREILQALHG